MRFRRKPARSWVDTGRYRNPGCWYRCRIGKIAVTCTHRRPCSWSQASLRTVEKNNISLVQLLISSDTYLRCHSYQVFYYDWQIMLKHFKKDTRLYVIKLNLVTFGLNLDTKMILYKNCFNKSFHSPRQPKVDISDTLLDSIIFSNG